MQYLPNVDTPIHPNSLSLLKAYLRRKYLAPVIYDSINHAQVALVRSIVKSTRTLASQCILMFLMEYPIEGSRMKDHLGFLVSNLGYFQEDNVADVRKTIEAIIRRIPADYLS